MTRRLLIITFDDPVAGPWCWALLNNGEVEQQAVVRADADKAGLANLEADSTVLIVAGEAVRLQTLELPPVARKDKLQAAGLNLGDEVAGREDDLHVVLAPGDENRVAVISASYLSALVGAVQATGLSPDAIYAEPEALWLEDGVYQMGNRLAVPGPLGFAVDSEWQSHLPPPYAKTKPVDLSPIQYLTALGEGVESGELINLADGKFKFQKSETGWRSYRRVAALVLLMGLTALGWQAVKARAYDKAAEDVRAATSERYAEYFGAAAPANPAQAITKALSERGSAEDTYQRLSLIMLQSLQAVPGVSVDSQQYLADEGVLTLELLYPDFGAAQQFENAVRSAGGRVTPGATRQGDDGITGDVSLQLGGAS